MITGAYVENTSGLAVLAAATNALSPDTIITQASYFCIERILMLLDNDNGQAAQNCTVTINFVSSNCTLANGTIPVSIFTGAGLYNKNGKPLLIIPPNENINIIYTNATATTQTFHIEFSGYYVDDAGLRASGGQALNKVLINTIL